MASENLLFANGLIRTLDPAQPTAEAVLVRSGRVVAAGTTHDMRTLASGQVREIDLAGSTLLPGFIESHNHFLGAGLSFADVNVRGDRCASIADLQRLIGERARATPAGEWVVGKGYDQTLLAENRHPTRYDLDTVTPDNPCVIFHVSFHGFRTT